MSNFFNPTIIEGDGFIVMTITGDLPRAGEIQQKLVGKEHLKIIIRADDCSQADVAAKASYVNGTVGFISDNGGKITCGGVISDGGSDPVAALKEKMK